MRILISLITVSLCSALNADVTFVINKGGLQNDIGIATNGMSFGFLVSTNDSLFDLGNYTAWDITTNGQFLSTDGGSTFTDDYFVYGGTQSTGQTPPTTVSSPLGDGSVGSVGGILEVNLTQGDPFMIVWFPSNSAATGISYGAASDGGTNMIVPPSGSSNVAPASLNTLSPDYVVAVPEPSQIAAVIGALALGLVIWRRRK